MKTNGETRASHLPTGTLKKYTTRTTCDHGDLRPSESPSLSVSRKIPGRGGKFQGAHLHRLSMGLNVFTMEYPRNGTFSAAEKEPARILLKQCTIYYHLNLIS